MAFDAISAGAVRTQWIEADLDLRLANGLSVAAGTSLFIAMTAISQSGITSEVRF